MKTSPASATRARPRTLSRTAAARATRGAVAIAAWACFVINPALAQVAPNTLPTGPKVNAGQATVSTVGSAMTVNQASAKASLDWQSFSIGSSASVNFSQPSASAIALNRVVGTDPSHIFGSLSANGQVFLINPAGVVFAPGARVDVGGIVASTLNMSDGDFLAGRYVFSGDSQAAVVNQGTIITSIGGYAALLGASASNEGLIVANLGTVAIAAGSRVVMDPVGDGLINFSVDGAAVRALAANRGLIQADGGRVVMSARSADDLVGTVLNQTGLIEARSASMRNGEIVLDGGTGGVNLAGTVDASGTASGQGGGSIAVRGGDIVNSGTLRANAGDNATAGNISVVAAGDLTLEGTSRVEARGASVFSNAGNIYMYGSGDATAKVGQVIDVSGGTTSGDGGTAEFSAGHHGRFGGTFLGEAAQGYRKGRLLIDPVSASLDGTYAGGTLVIQAEDGITIDADVTITAGNTLTLLADHDDNGGSPALGIWDAAGGDGSTVGVGTITRSGAFTITGAASSSLILAAGGSGVADGYAIGTAANPILTSMNGGNISVYTDNPAQSGGGHASISNTGAMTLLGVSSSTNANNFILASSDTVALAGNVTTAGNVAMTTTGTGSILYGSGTITAPTVNLTAGGSIGALGTPVILDVSGAIVLSAQGDLHAFNMQAISDLALTVNPGTTGTQTYSVDDNAGAAGLAASNITDDTAGNLVISSLQRQGTSNVKLSVTSQTGDISIDDGAITAGSGNVSLTATTGSIKDSTTGADGAAHITTTGTLTLIAQGAGASIGDPAGDGDIDISGMTNITLRTNNNAIVSGGTTPTDISITADPSVATGGAVNYSVQLGGGTVVAITEDGSNNLQVDSVTNGGTALNFSLTAPAGNITLADVTGGAINLSGTGSAVVLTAQAGAVTDASAPVNSDSSIILTDPTSTLTLVTATGIGTALNRLNTQVPLISVTNTASGPVNISNTGSLTVTAFSNTGTGVTSIATVDASDTGPNTLTIAANIIQSGAISLNAGETTGSAADDVVINPGITVQSTGGGVILQAGDNVSLGANSVIQASTSVAITAGSGDLDTFGGISMGNPSTVTAGTTASLSAVEDITVSAVGAGTSASITSSAGSIFDDTNDTTLIAAPTGVSLSAVTGAVGADNTTGDVDTDTASLTANVGTDLFVTNSNTTLSSLTLTLRPTGSATYFLGATTTGIPTFTVTDNGDLNVTNVTADPGNNLALSITNAATASNVFVDTITTNAGAATVVAVDGALTLTNAGTGINDSIVGPGAATLTASGLLTLDGNINSTGASLTGDGVTQNTGSTVNAGTGDILVDATNGAVNTDGVLTTSSNTATAIRILATSATGGITQTAGSTISATGVGGGVITLDAGLSPVVQDGAITNAGNAATSVSITGTGITQKSLLTDVGTINGGSGGVLIDANNGVLDMKGSITTTSATTTAVRIIDTGAATLGDITALNGTVTLGVGPLVTDADVINGNLNQNASTLIKAATLAGVVNGETNLTNPNEIGTVGTFTSLTHFELLDNNDAASAHNSGVTITGPVTTVDGGNTTSGGFNIQITANSALGDNTGAINLFVDNIVSETSQSTQASKAGNVKLAAENSNLVTGTANILEAGGGDGGVDVRGNVLTFSAKNDIGAVAGAGPIEIQANTLNMTSGGIASVAQTGAINLGAISTDSDFTFTAAGTITVVSPMALNGDTLITASGTGSNIIVQEDITRTSDAAGSFTLRAENHIMFRLGADFIAANATNTSPSATAVTLNSDRNASGGGAIYIGEHSVLRSNSGTVTLGGGSDPTTTAAIGNNEALLTKNMFNGVVLEGKIDAGAGAVSLRGQSVGPTGAPTGGVAGVIIRDTNASSAGDTITVPSTYSMWIDGVEHMASSTPAFTGSGDITTTTGAVSITGVGDKGAGNTQGVLVTSSDATVGGTTITTASGAISITGSHVSPTTVGTNDGVLVNNGAVISSTGTAGTAGAVTFTGTGGSGAGSDSGVIITSAGTTGSVRTTVSVDGAALNLVGTGGGGGATGGASNIGVQLLGGADVKTIGTGKVTVTGTGGATDGGTNYGIVVSGQNASLSDPLVADRNTLLRSTTNAATALRIELIGTGGAGTAAADGGILIDSNAQVRTDTSNIAMTGTGGAGASGSNSNNFGIQISNDARVITASSGSIALTGTGGATNDGTNYGIKVTGGGVVESLLAASGAGAISFTGTGGAGSGPSDVGIFIEGSSSPATPSRVRSTVGNITLTGTGGAGATDATDDSNYGIHVSNSAVVETLGAAQLTLDGTGSTTSNDGSNFGVWIDLAGVVRSTGGAQTGTAGKITIIGQGGLGTGALDGGIGMQSGGTVSTVDAEIELQGFGGTDTTGAGSSHGIFVDGGQILTTGDGAILLTGVGGTSAGGSNHGIFTLGGALIESTTDNALNPPAGTISFDGTAGVGAAGNNIGVAITDDSIVRSKDGFIDIFGTAAAAGASAGNVGVLVATDALITSTASPNPALALATITIDGFGSTTGSSNAYGIQMASGAGITSTGTGTITLTGVGGGTTSGGNNNYGIWADGTDTRITSVTGNITLDGTGGGTGTSTSNVGVIVSGDADIATTGAANIDITGLSGITNGAGNVGVNITGTDTTISSSGTATSDITIIGTGRGSGASATGSAGVVVSSDAVITTTGAGDIDITGTGATSGAGTAYGIQAASGAGITSTGTGTITLTGTGGSASSADANYGILVTGTGTLLDTRVTSVTGDISLDGTGGSTGVTTSANIGVVINGEADIASTGAAAIDIIGRSGITTGGVFNYGVLIRGSDTTVASGGTATSDITIDGTGRGTGTTASGVVIDNSALVTTTGAGDIGITGTGSATGTGSSIGVLVDIAGTISSVGGAGLITLTGTGGGTAGSSNNVGVQFGNDSRAISTGTGSITVTGTGAASTNGNSGVRITDTNNAGTTAGITAAGGAITVTGYRKGTGDSNVGVELIGATLIESTGAGNITILGDNAPAVAYTTGDQGNVGVYMNLGASATGGVIRTTSTGAISITGTGSGSYATPGAPFAFNAGVSLENATVDSQQVAAGGGSVTITGTGAASAGDQDNGVQLVTSSVLSKSGNITISGTRQGSGNERGVIIQASSVIGSTAGSDATGAISITGTDGSDAAVRGITGTNIIGGDTWTGPITITGAGTNSGILLDDTNIKIKTGSATGNVLITSPDAVQLGGTTLGNIDAGASTVTITTNTDDTAASNEGFTQATGSITTTNSTASAVSITANTNAVGGGTSDILFRGITAGTGAAATITLTSNDGDINEQDPTGATGRLTATGGSVVLSATGTGVIGFLGTTNRNPVRTDAAFITATTTDGTISILDSGAVPGVTFTTVTTGNNNRIDLQALTGDITLGTIGTATTNTGDVNILARAGSILNDASTATRVTGGTVTLNASNAIGASGNFLDTTAASIAAQSGAGGTFIRETDAVILTQTAAPLTANAVTFAGNTITSVSEAPINTFHSTTGDYQLTAGGTITTTALSGITLGGNTLITAGVDPAGAPVADQDIVVSNSIAQSNGALRTFELRASRNIVFNGGADLTAGGAGALTVTLNSDRDGTGGGAIYLGLAGAPIGSNFDTDSDISSNNGAVTLVGGTTGATAAIGNNNTTGGFNTSSGVVIEGDITAGTGIVTVRGQSLSNGTSVSGVAIRSGGSINTTTGNVIIVGTGDGGAAGGDVAGVRISGPTFTTDGVFATSGGNISITGNHINANSGTAAGSPGIVISASTVSAGGTSGAGTVTLLGTGANSAADGDTGIEISASVVQTRNGLMTLTGTGGTGGSDNMGLDISGSTVRTIGTGNVQINGTGGTGVNDNFGILVDGSTIESQVATTGGTVTLVGTAGAASTGIENVGVVVDSGTIQTNGRALSITGTGSVGTTSIAPTDFNYGVAMLSSTVTSGLSGGTGGTVTILGTAGTASGSDNAGVYADATTISALGDGGNVSITGTGGSNSITAGTSTTNNHGVQLVNATGVTATGTGTITIDGTAGAGTSNNRGVYITDASTTVTAVNGLINIIGEGAGSAGSGIGVSVESAALIESSGSGGITLTGTTTSSGGSDNYGIGVSAATVRGTGTSSGAILLDGTGGAGTTNNIGVLVDNAGVVESLNTATLTFDGTGGAGTDGNDGVRIDNSSVVQTAQSGALEIIGTGAGTGTANRGVLVDNGSQVLSAQVAAGGGAITVTGFGSLNGTGEGDGIRVANASSVSTFTGNVILEGTGRGAGTTANGVELLNGVDVTSGGAATIAVIGTGNLTSPDILASTGTNTIGGASATGEILLRGTTVGGIQLGDGVSPGSDTVNVQTTNDLTLVSAGGATQNSGALLAPNLRVRGTGTFALTRPGNTVTTVAGNLTGTLSLTTNGALAIGSITSDRVGNPVTVDGDNGLTVAGDATLTTAGAITQTCSSPATCNPMVVSGATSLDAGGNAITLTDPSNDFGTVNVANASNVQLTDVNNLDLGSIAPTGTLTVNAASLTDTGPVVVPGLTTFNVGGNMLLDNAASDFSSVTFNVGGDAALADANDLVVNTSTVGGTLTLTTLGSLNTTPNNVVTVGGGVFINAGVGGVGTLFNDFHLNTNGTITLNITGTVPGSPGVSGFVINDGSGLLNLITPPTGLVRFQIVEFQPPTPATAASFLSMTMSEVTQEETTDELFVTDDPEGAITHAFRHRIGLMPNGADVNRNGAIRMPAGLQQGADSGRSFVPEDEEERRRRKGN